MQYMLCPKGAYKWTPTKNAHERRINLIGTSNWVDNMVRAINNADYFRWFDSGDLQSDEMLADIVRVALATLTPSTGYPLMKTSWCRGTYASTANSQAI